MPCDRGEVGLTNSRVSVSVRPPFRPKRVISVPIPVTVGPFSVPDGGFGAPRLMATNNRIRVMIGLCVLGSIGWATVRDHADADEPRDANAVKASASTPAERYLMLANGKIIKGIVTEDEKEFFVRQRIGVDAFFEAAGRRSVRYAFATPTSTRYNNCPTATPKSE